MEKLFAEHASAIGHLTIAFNAIEQKLVDIIGELLGDNHAAEIVASPLSFSKKLDVMAALIRYKVTDAKILQVLDSYLKDLPDLNAARNSFIHAEWWPQFEGEDQDLESINRRRFGIRKHRLSVKHDAPETRADNAARPNNVLDCWRYGFFSRRHSGRPSGPGAGRKFGHFDCGPERNG